MISRNLVLAALGSYILMIPNILLAHDFNPAQLAPEVTNLPGSARKYVNNPTTAGGVNAVVNLYKVWKPGSTLIVCFVGGTPEVRQFFVETERLWEEYESVVWDFGSAPSYRNCDPSTPSHIRVAFAHTGHWSMVGTDAIQKSVLGQVSLNIDIDSFGTFSLVDKDMVRGVMLHEQGHALGMEHEHQSPNDPCIMHIKWDVVYASMGAPPNNWDQAKVDLNLRALVANPRLKTTQYDPKSIMHYTFPASWFDKPSCAVTMSTSLSALDEQEIGMIYPKDPSKTQEPYLSRATERAKTTFSALDVSEEDMREVQTDIENLDKKLDEKLKNSASVVTSNNNSGIFFGGSVKVTTTGSQSPAVVGTQGPVNINIGTPPITSSNP